MADTFPAALSMGFGGERDRDLLLRDFDTAVRAHQPGLFRLLMTELRDEDAAATLTQECLLRAYQSRESFRGDASLKTWLYRIAINLARDHQRSKRAGFWRRLFRGDNSEPVTHLAPDPAPSAERALVAREQLAAVMRAVETLSAQQRTAFHLRFIEEMSNEEVARVMGIEVGTAKVHVSRAVGAVRRIVKESAI